MLRDHALAVQGTFDDVTSRVAMMSGTKGSTQREIKFRSERIRAIVDGERPSSEGQVTSDTRNAPSLLPSTDERFENALCYYCGVKGHIARDCAKKKRDKSSNSGRGTGEGGKEGKAAILPPKRN